MKGNQNLPNRQVTSINMTGKPLPFLHRSRREHRNHSRHRSPNKFSQNNSKPYYGNSNFKPPSRNSSPYPRPNFQTNSQYNSRPQSPHYNRDGNCSRGPFSRNRLRNVRNNNNSLLDQEQSGNTTSGTLTEKYILSNSCKNNIRVIPLTIYTQQTTDHKKTISPRF